ncbi:MAG TPA: acetylornithine deacetylase [Solirubrobacteraceae bacterium]|nr:acetylornithine deacetylase [Solirubrobacteraceae bacterium]
MSALEILSDLVAEPTVAGRSNLALIDALAERLSGLGAAVRVVESVREDARNLHAVLGPADAPGGILLAAHSDVVDVEGQPWTHDPFALSVRDGRAYGRGSADMKGFLAAALAALERDGLARRLRRPVHIALSSDEELGCRGVGPLLDALAELPVRPAWALVGEPTELRIVDRHKGKAAARIELRGLAAHSSVPADGVNAVAHAGVFIARLLELAEELRAGPLDRAFRAPFSTVGIGPVRGGVAVNIVPDRCTLDVELRTVPAVDPLELMERVRALADDVAAAMRAEHDGCGVSVEPLSSYPGLAPADDGGVGRCAAAVSAALEEDAGGGPAAVDFGTEAGLYARALGIPVLVCGPGSMRDAHRANESLALDQLVAAETMVARLCETLTAA